ncbi:MAG: hypothetical protein V1880_03220 [Patescibacteria group bacterium]
MSTCKQCNTGFQITDSDRAFYQKVSPVFGGKRFLIPEPEHCPDCRQILRLQWRNERTLYQRKCALCGKSVISIYAPDGPFIVYCYNCWWGDAWNALDFGRDFDFNRPFFEQFAELLKAVPKAALVNYAVENCDYDNYVNESKSCHLCFGSGYMEDCMYMDWSYHGKDTLDCSFNTNFELGYMNVDCSDTYSSKFCQDCHNVSDCAYSFDLRNCKNCLGCVGLRSKEYHIFNKPYTKEQYFEMIEKLNDPKHAENIRTEVKKLKAKHPHQASRLINSENCTGDYLQNSKNSHYCFEGVKLEDCKYMCDVFVAKDCMDHNRTGETELSYFNGGGGYYRNTLFSAICCDFKWGLYSFECMYSKNVFGSVGLNHNEYVVLNKQYSVDEYNELMPKIIRHVKETGEWGRFFPPFISPFAYNETLAQEFFPSTKAACESAGYRWRDADKRDYRPQTVQVPENIQEVPDTLVNEVLACKKTSKNFKITSQELNFYKKQQLPIPELCPDQRYFQRLALKNPRKLWDRTCAKCQTVIKTSYSPDRPEIVYCEQCYLKEVY